MGSWKQGHGSATESTEWEESNMVITLERAQEGVYQDTWV
jgi:hypothetical protein